MPDSDKNPASDARPDRMAGRLRQIAETFEFGALLQGVEAPPAQDDKPRQPLTGPDSPPESDAVVRAADATVREPTAPVAQADTIPAPAPVEEGATAPPRPARRAARPRRRTYRSQREAGRFSRLLVCLWIYMVCLCVGVSLGTLAEKMTPYRLLRPAKPVSQARAKKMPVRRAPRFSAGIRSRSSRARRPVAVRAARLPVQKPWKPIPSAPWGTRLIGLLSLSMLSGFVWALLPDTMIVSTGRVFLERALMALLVLGSVAAGALWMMALIERL